MRVTSWQVLRPLIEQGSLGGQAAWIPRHVAPITEGVSTAYRRRSSSAGANASYPPVRADAQMW